MASDDPGYETTSVDSTQKIKNNQKFTQRLFDSFKKSKDLVHEGRLTDESYIVTNANTNVTKSKLARRLKNVHIQMLCFGGVIGSGLFMTTGLMLSTGGPAAYMICMTMVAIMLYCMCQSMAELCVMYPVSGAFASFSTRFIDPAWGSAMAGQYAILWLIAYPLEVVGAAIVVQFWGTNMPTAAFVTLFLALITFINLLEVRGYGNVEAVFAAIKVLAVIGFIIMALVVDGGGGPSKEYLGTLYWHDPGAFAAGFKGVCATFVLAAFALGGIEVVGLTSAETEKPEKVLPRAIKQVFWRLLIIYLLSMFMITLLVPYNDPLLLSGTSSKDPAASPFVIAIYRAGIPVLPSIFNAVLLIAAVSTANTCVYASSRTLCSMAEQNQLPQFFAYVDRRGRPLLAILFSLLFGLLGYLAAHEDMQLIFNWLLSICALAFMFTWGSICLAHIRFRQAWKAKGRKVSEIPYRATTGVFGSWVGLIFNFTVLVLQLWIAIDPVGGQADASSFFQAYLAVPVAIVWYFSFKIWKKTRIARISEMDLDMGRRIMAVMDEDVQRKRKFIPWLC